MKSRSSSGAARRRFAGLASLVLAASLASSVTIADDSDVSYSRDGADSCLACHEDAVTLGVFKTPHGSPHDPNGPFGAGQLQCEACHGPGGPHSGRVRRGQERPPVVLFGSGTATPIAEQNGYCLDCHAADAGTAWHAGPHGADRLACADCHVSHEARDPMMTRASQDALCVDCHASQHAAKLKPFGHALDANMGCGDCHSVHDARGPAELVRATTNQTCYQCHADKRGPFVWEHAPVAEDCTTCHAPHGSNQPGMLTRRAPLLCQSCHSQAGHPSFANTPDGLAGGTPSTFLLGQNCMNCHSQVHGSNHPSGSRLMR